MKNPAFKDLVSTDAKLRGAEFVSTAILKVRYPDDRAAQLDDAKNLSPWAQEIVRCPESIGALVRKAAQEPGTIANDSPEGWGPALAAHRNGSSGFIATLQNLQGFDTIVGSMQRGVMNSNLMVSTAILTGATGSEGAWKPMTQGVFRNDTLPISKVHALALFTEEIIRFAGTSVVGIANRQLQNAANAATTLNFVTQIIADTTPVASSDSGLPGMLVDVQLAIDGVGTGGDSKLFWLMNADNAKALTFMPTANGARAYPEMSPTGGEFYSIPVIVSDQVGTNIILLDANGFVGDPGFAILETFTQGDIKQWDEGSPGDAETLTSLWQTNSRAILAERWFGFKQIRDDAVYVIESVDWTSKSPGIG